MSSSNRGLEPVYPTYDEVQLAIARAHALRGQVIRESFRKLGASLHRFLSPRPAGLSKLTRKHA